METDVKKDELTTILATKRSNEKLSVENVKKFLEEGKTALENLLKIRKEEAQELLKEFTQWEEDVKEWKKVPSPIEAGKAKTINEWCNSNPQKTPTGYQLFAQEKSGDINLIKINKFITYCDLVGSGIGTPDYNQTGIVMAQTGVRQDDWTTNLLKYIINGKKKENIANSIIRAIKYFTNPESYLSITSKDHLDLISQYYLGYKAEDADLIEYFNHIFESENQEQAYKNKLYTQVLYDKKESKKWKSKAIDKGVIDLLDNHYNVILTGAPGTGKTYLAKNNLVFKKGGNEMEEEDKNKFLEECVKFVQFHPTYDYTDFVEGLRPITDSNDNIVFERKDGIFKRFCKCAILGLPIDASDEYIDEYMNGKKDGEYKNKKYLFIIDEINRGDISKIFGELFFAIDPGYRGERGRVDTQYQTLVKDNDIFNKGFYIPDNVYIIGTMNDIDRSVESLDFAFRRRFAFKEILVEDTQEAILDFINEELRKKLISKMNKLNDKLGKLGLNEAYYIGAAYFKKIEKYSAYNPDIQFKKLWEDHLKGVLYEYFRGEVDADKKLTELKEIYDKD